MAAVNISSVVEQLEGTLVRERDKGVEDLKFLLASSRNGSKLNALGDDGFHRIFESLYSIVKIDKSNFLKAAHTKARTPSTNRLASAATALRLTVEAGVSKIRFKTAVSVIDHIISTLPTSDDDFIEPLRNDYLKCFRILVEYSPYGEHLKPKQWHEYVDFALAGISVSLRDDEQDGNHLPGRDVSMTSKNSSHISLRVSQSHRSFRSAAKSSLDDIVSAVRALSDINNAPIMSRASDIINSSFETLIASSRSQALALEVFNNIALVLKTEDVNLLHQNLSRLIPILSRLWSTKSVVLRDQILVTLAISRPIFLADRHAIGYLDPALREKVLDMLLNEYMDRNSREILQFEETSLELLGFDLKLHGSRLSPRRDSPRALSSWSLLSIVAALACGLSNTSRARSSSTTGQPTKRRKLSTPLHMLLKRAMQSDGLEQLAAVQTLFFCYEHLVSLPSEIEEEIPSLEPLLQNEDPQLGVWTTLLFSRFAWSSMALEARFTAFWTRIWDQNRRAITSSLMSRAACFLVDTMIRRSGLEPSMNAMKIQDCLFGTKSGPASFSDTTLIMFTTILQSDFVDRDKAYESLSLKIVVWLELYWTLPPVLDRGHNSLLALHGQPEFLCALMSALRGCQLEFEIHQRQSTPHSLTLVEALLEDSNGFSNYISGSAQPEKPEDRAAVVVKQHQLSKGTTSSLNYAVFELLRAKSRDFQSSWSDYSKERSSNIGEDVTVIVATLCIAICVNLQTAVLDPSLLATMSSARIETWSKIHDLLLQSKAQSNSRGSLVASKLLRIRDPPGSPGPILSKRMLPMMQTLVDVLRRDVVIDEDDGIDIDMLDSLENKTSQGTQSGSSTKTVEASRRELKEGTVPNDSPTCCVLDLSLQCARGLASEALGPDTLSGLVDDFVALDSDSLLGARRSLYELFRLDPGFHRPDAARLLKHMAEVCLQDDDYERSEAAMCCCAKTMTELVPLWTSEIDDDLSDCAFDIYCWFIGTALGKGIASPQALFDIALMLDAVSHLAPDFGSNDDLPSPRTSLLKILSEGPSGLKFRLSACFTRMFDRYVLAEHVAIFNDIVEALPADPDNIEGIGVRFHILADLGSRWHTVLRQATYHLFETAINVPKLTGLGRQCLHRMSAALEMVSARELFNAFALQIIYTWLGLGQLKQLPFASFEYETLTDLLMKNESELVAQIALRGSREHAQEMSELLNTTWASLLEKHFAQAEGYCLASQTSLPGREQLQLNSESLIRTTLGTEVYSTNIRQQLPSVITHLFKALQDDYGIERAFEKSSLTEALSTLQRVCALSASTSPLPSAQQPSFRARFIIEEIYWLCKRTSFDFNMIWSPAFLVHIYRQLLQGANAVLGPLHAASVLRKIRAVVCLAGPNAVRGYPLEMLLHNLRPFLTIFQCSEDAIGLYWYLLEAGIEHLASQLSFLAGLSVSIFASMTVFIASTQESTTQSSQFLSTISKAKDFRKWLGRFLTTLEPDEDNEQKLETFRKLIQHAKAMTVGGSSSKSTPEGNVLMHLLMDRTMKEPLLTEVHFQLSIGILCKQFTPATDLSDDILTQQMDIVSCTPVLQAVLAQMSLPDPFRTWAACIIGRGCSAVGPAEILHPSDSKSKILRGDGHPLSTTDSYSAIVSSLEGLVWQSDVSAAAKAEQCLQAIATNLEGSAALAALGKGHDQRLLGDLRFDHFPCPESVTDISAPLSSLSLEHWQPPEMSHDWAPALVSTICHHLVNDSIIGPLRNFAMSASMAAPRLLPYVVHLALATEWNGAQHARERISAIFALVLKNKSSRSSEVIKLILETIVYLRRCALPTEATKAQRNHWLDIDFGEAASAAVTFHLWHEALFFIELQQADVHLLSGRSTRQSTQTAVNDVPDFAEVVFENVDDPDFFYAGHEDVDLQSVIQRLEHESSGFKTLSFQSAVFDAAVRSHEGSESLGRVALSTAHALNTANLRGISQAVTAVASGQSQSALESETSDLFFDLYDWHSSSSTAATKAPLSPLRSLQTLTSATSKEAMLSALDTGLLEAVTYLPLSKSLRERDEQYVRAIATLAETRDALMLNGFEEFESFLELQSAVDIWSQKEDIASTIPFLNGREYLFGTIRCNEELRDALALTQPQALLLEARTVRLSLQIAQHHSASQFSLSRATYLSRLAELGTKVGLELEVASQFDLAGTFWSHGESSASVKILQRLKNRNDLKTQNILIEPSEILANLGTKAAEARLEPPDEIISNYLVPAYKELGGNTMGSKAGRVFHNFATFCDSQLQDQDNRDDYERVAKIRETKELEIQELEKLLKSRDTKNREGVKHALGKAKSWYKLDHEEFQRVSANRESLILRCLENYLLSMKACDDFANDSLRVLSIWLNQADNERVNKTINKFLRHVPSIKFAGLVNQLTSRLLDTENDFQQLLMDLMFRICTDHPYHSMYQLFAASKSRGAKSDDVAASRHGAAGKLSDLLRQSSRAGSIWIALHNASIAFVRVAQEKIPQEALKTGSKFQLRKFRMGPPLISAIEGRSSSIPPPTMKISLRTDKDYSSTPVMVEVEPQVSVAGGVSVPKIITIKASDGSRNKMLLKGGNDDLRQDAIMEQVFEQVSNLLQDHRATRQRKLGIRTYKVVPLVSNAGIIEFVQGTLPLHDYILPAHVKYFPKDWKPNKCKKDIMDAQGRSLQQRVQTFRTITQNFHPIMRFFFMEHFLDPDEWFYKRLNYSRSTAAISILGHVLGLGDRHGHNILLDTNTGEAVHIDLGIAFEAGRVLPVPEVVPFRLTRDLVDGMGISGVEGVFRRCCNFTLEALRREQESIMTILDVLRYDPLYSWSISPVRLQKMQENAEQAAAAAAAGNTDTNATGTTDGAIAAAAGLGRKDNEPSEADRALTVVAKKLGKSLSVEATVNELIRQATDERNLAVLYCGWAAYA